jgi:NADP-dependent 3-hydroxy acid dehydrogenase YdfG
MSKIVFITGATSGFGKACAAKNIAAHGYDLILNAEEPIGFTSYALRLKGNTILLYWCVLLMYARKRTVMSTISSLPPTGEKLIY